MSDDELFALVRRHLFTAVIGDVLDNAGLTRQFLPPHIRPLHPDGDILVGRAMPVLQADLEAGADAGSEQAFGLMFQALDALKPGEIYICTGGTPAYALWGGLMSTRAAKLGAVGAVLDGFHRDTREILKLGFPVFSAGAYAQDQRRRGKVVDFRCPIEFANGCRVAPGDLIVADIDGIVVVPAKHEREIAQAALSKVTGEEEVRQAILGGESTESVFRKTGIM